MAAYQHVNRVFYSRKNIVRRWLRLMRDFRSTGHIFRRIFRRALASYIFFQLSKFQRDHAQQKVYGIENAEWFDAFRTRPEERTRAGAIQVVSLPPGPTSAAPC